MMDILGHDEMLNFIGTLHTFLVVFELFFWQFQPNFVQYFQSCDRQKQRTQKLMKFSIYVWKRGHI